MSAQVNIPPNTPANSPQDSELDNTQKRTRILLIVLGSLLLVAGAVFYFLFIANDGAVFEAIGERFKKNKTISLEPSPVHATPTPSPKVLPTGKGSGSW